MSDLAASTAKAAIAPASAPVASAAAVSALPGRVAQGFVTLAEAGLRGMITLRGDLSAPQIAAAAEAITGLSLPAPRRIVTSADGQTALAWMSPDELLLVLPHAEAPAAVARLDSLLAGTHYLAANVSDARATFTLQGPRAPEALMKLFPVDFASFAPGEIRRSRMGQVSAAVWCSQEGSWSIVCFRSVAAYAFALLENASLPGSEIFPA